MLSGITFYGWIPSIFGLIPDLTNPLDSPDLYHPAPTYLLSASNPEMPLNTLSVLLYNLLFENDRSFNDEWWYINYHGNCTIPHTFKRTTTGSIWTLLALPYRITIGFYYILRTGTSTTPISLQIITINTSSFTWNIYWIQITTLSMMHCNWFLYKFLFSILFPNFIMTYNVRCIAS